VCSQSKEATHLLDFLLVSRVNQERNIDCNQSSSGNKHIAPQGFFLLSFGGAKQERKKKKSVIVREKNRD
jgi:hypothetical protein